MFSWNGWCHPRQASASKPHVPIEYVVPRNSLNFVIHIGVSVDAGFMGTLYIPLMFFSSGCRLLSCRVCSTHAKGCGLRKE